MKVLLLALLPLVVAGLVVAAVWTFERGRGLPPGSPAQTVPPGGELFCGGIGGVSCPAGYTCKLDGNYPDAGGHCARLGVFGL